MIKKVGVALLALVVGLSLSGLALAQGTPGYKGAEPAKPMAPADKPAEKPAEKPGEKSAEKPDMGKEATGKVVSVNASKKTLVIQADGKKKMTFTVAEAAAKMLSKFKRGDQVTVRYTEAGKKLMAQDITKGEKG